MGRKVPCLLCLSLTCMHVGKEGNVGRKEVISLTWNAISHALPYAGTVRERVKMRAGFITRYCCAE